MTQILKNTLPLTTSTQRSQINWFFCNPTLIYTYTEIRNWWTFPSTLAAQPSLCIFTDQNIAGGVFVAYCPMDRGDLWLCYWSIHCKDGFSLVKMLNMGSVEPNPWLSIQEAVCRRHIFSLFFFQKLIFFAKHGYLNCWRMLPKPLRTCRYVFEKQTLSQ